MHKYLLAALLASVSVTAYASDLPSKKAPPRMPPISAPAFSWTGFYVGANAGVGIGSLTNSNFSASNGGVVGGQVGYNYQVGQFVGGLEADLDATGMNRKGSGNKFETGALTTERLRAGYAIDHTLLFVTGGYAGVNTTAGVNGYGSETEWRNGGVIGVGAEYAITNNITVKAEYLYSSYADAKYFSGTPAAESNGLKINLVRAGVNYKF